MGNKGSKGGLPDQDPQQQQTQQQQQPPAPTPHTAGHGTEASIQPSTTTAVNNKGQQSTGTQEPLKDKQMEVGLAEFGSSDNISAQESYNHWDTTTQQNEGIGATKIRNKELEKTMRNTMRQTMCNGDLRQLVKLPPNADQNEWIALNTIHFYRTCCQIGETYHQLCTPESCPLMSAGNVEYLWKDDDKYPKPTRVPACEYMERALRETYRTIEDSNIFPADDSQQFPRIFIAKVKEIFKRLFRQFAHLYYSHYDQIKQGGSSKHLNSTFKHFIYFVLEFQLIDPNTLSPLQKFIDHIIQQNPNSGPV